jgi:TolB-like protein
MTLERVLDYEIAEKLGEGGIGVVYKARDLRLDRWVALKFLREYYSQDAEAMERFTREARAASALSHPNICTVHEIERDGEGRPFIVMELLQGRTLQERLRDGALTLAEAVDVARQLLEVLQSMHAIGIVHRDLKPANVFLTDSGRVKVLDFGLAKFWIGDEYAEAASVTGPGAVLGTLAYMSPEQAWGEEVDGRSDIFSFGALLYEMATGRQAFAAPSAALVFDAVLHKTPEAPSRVLPRLPEKLDAIVAMALAKDREKRPSAVALRHELAQLLAPVPASTAALEPPAKTRRQRRARGLALAAAVSLAALSAFLLLRGRPAPGYDAVAVLPFAVTGDAGSEYLGDGIAEGVINSLARLPKLRVVPRSVAFRSRGRESDLQSLARDLSVGVVVTGRVAAKGDQLAVSVELVDPARASQIWGRRFERPLRDLLALQEDVAGAISERLRPQRGAQESGTVARRVTENDEAYRLYLQGRYHWERRTDEAIRRSLELYQQALALDPGFALAYAGLADSYVALSTSPPRESRPQAKAAALQALQLDDSLAEAHTALAMIKFVFDWDFKGAETSFRRALQLDPSHATAHHWYGLLLMSLGRFGEARGELGSAQEQDPLSLIIPTNLARVELFAKNDAFAVARLRRVLVVDPGFHWAHGFLSVALLRTGLPEEGVAEAEKASARDDAADGAAWRGYAYARGGRRADALRVARGMEARASSVYLPPFRVGVVYAALGDRERALSWFEKAFRDRSPWLAYAKHDPMLDDALRGDARFQDLMRRVGVE